MRSTYSACVADSLFLLGFLNPTGPQPYRIDPCLQRVHRIATRPKAD